MKTAGIIAEYNPFHEGHAWHLKKTREVTQADAVVVILTGAFSSRGLPSLLSTEEKTRLALKHGADLVLELPVVYAAQSADQFARHALESLAQVGIDVLCFGSESNDLSRLEELVDPLTSLEKNPATSQARNAARMAALAPNDILGVQYIRWCRPWHIQPVSIQRQEQFKSATQTRKDYFSGQPQLYGEHFLAAQNWTSYYPYLRLFLQLTSPEQLRTYFLVNEGIEYRLQANARACGTWEEFLEASISRTYSRNRIQRTCLFILLQITKEQMKANDSYEEIKVLGFNEIGRQLLKQLRDQAPIKTRFADLSPFMKEVHLKTKALYDSVMQEPSGPWRIVYEKMD